MSDAMKVRIQTTGPEFWRISVTDADTGRIVPILWDEQHGIELRQDKGLLYARVDLVVYEVDADLPIAVNEHVMRISAAEAEGIENVLGPLGPPIRRPVAASASAEIVKRALEGTS